MNPASNYMIPVCYYGNNNRFGSTTPDAIPYNGVPVAAASSPYPSDAAAGNYLLAVTNASSPFNSNPASARNPPLGFWWEEVDGARTDESNHQYGSARPMLAASSPNHGTAKPPATTASRAPIQPSLPAHIRTAGGIAIKPPISRPS